ncbi:acylneuraminate cytidylyltransferase family protein [Lachnospira pectinoschiza]|uniref:CMP-N,N'-diacetyllegionaminic acid synthase n=1 Tax=Lachnospira pectinoschiza TaxID=28052 RepID=A0A1G9XKD6_9FIRM|nr:acylneuraminate cytidylyltransferase family protein [Lachnospira pectinoschiza]SDM97218.1 CMP-N,N'-diacetyllegionaminic acid synthase [Lachnospira pectinoschiza]
MINGKKVLALIPARGGSKGIPNKNILKINRKPLIAYTIHEALSCDYIDAVVVSTDSEAIAKAATKAGAEVPFMRPEELAGDKAKSIDAVLHAITMLKNMGREYDYVVLLQATSPLRNASDIAGALKTFVNNGEKGLASVSEVLESPILMRKFDESGKLVNLIEGTSTMRRQDMPTFYKVNGAIYINKVEELTKDTSLNDNEQGYIMDRTHSVDVDDYEDIAVVNYYLGALGRK